MRFELKMFASEQNGSVFTAPDLCSERTNLLCYIPIICCYKFIFLIIIVDRLWHIFLAHKVNKSIRAMSRNMQWAKREGKVGPSHVQHKLLSDQRNILCAYVQIETLKAKYNINHMSFLTIVVASLRESAPKIHNTCSFSPQRASLSILSLCM